VFGLVTLSLIATACGGSQSAVSTDGPTTTRGATVVMIDGLDPTTTTVAEITPATTGGPATTVATTDPITTTSANPGSTTTSAAPPTTSPVEALGGDLIADLFGGSQPARVVLLDGDVIEDHRAGQAPYAQVHEIVDPWASVSGGWISGFTFRDGLWAAPITDDGEARQIPEGWWLTEHQGQAVIAPNDCYTSSATSIEVRSVETLEVVATLSIHDLGVGIAPGEYDCWGTYLRGDTVLTLASDPEGNAAAVTNAVGIDLTGTDYAGHLVLDPPGDRVAYTNQFGSPSPHVAFEVVTRDTASGTELGRWTTERSITDLEFQGRWLVARVVGAEFEQVGLLSIDTATGAQRFVETPIRLLLPSP